VTNSRSGDVSGEIYVAQEGEMRSQKSHAPGMKLLEEEYGASKEAAKKKAIR